MATANDTRTFRTLDDVRAANRDGGGNWFSPDAMGAWGMRHGRTLYGGRYFTSSEPFAWTGPRVYSVRAVDSRGHVYTVGELGGYASGGAANRAAARFARAGRVEVAR